MKLVDPRTGLEHLDRETCLELLAGECIGRLVIVHGRAPEMFLVNYALDGDAVVFRSDPGTKVALAGGAAAAFEIDHLDRSSREGWSVVVFGHLEEVTRFDPTSWERVRHLDVDPWAGGVKQHWLRLVPTRISGRRLDHTSHGRGTIDPGAWASPRSS